jgi:hypothetical protein
MTYYLVKGDTGTKIKVALARQGTVSPIDLNAATAVLKVRAEGVKYNVFEVTGTKDLTNDNEAIFALGANMLTITPGRYSASVEVTFDDTTIETVYEILPLFVRDEF